MLSVVSLLTVSLITLLITFILAQYMEISSSESKNLYKELNEKSHSTVEELDNLSSITEGSIVSSNIIPDIEYLEKRMEIILSRIDKLQKAHTFCQNERPAYVGKGKRRQRK